MDQDNKQNTSGQVSGKDLPPLSGTGVDVKTPEEVSKKVSVDNDVPVKPEPVKAKPVSASAIPDNEGLPPLETAEDETFDLGLVDKNKKEESGGEKEEDLKEVEKIEKATLPPLPATDVNETSESLKEVKEMSEINSENQETPPPLPPEEPPVAPGKIEEKPLTTEGIDMGDDGEEGKKKGKKKISKKTIVGGLIALVLLIGVPVLALNLDYFRGDVREKAYYIPNIEPTTSPKATATPALTCKSKGGSCVPSSTADKNVTSGSHVFVNGTCSSGSKCIKVKIGTPAKTVITCKQICVPSSTADRYLKAGAHVLASGDCGLGNKCIKVASSSNDYAKGGVTSCAELKNTGYSCVPANESSGEICGPFTGCDAGKVCCLTGGKAEDKTKTLNDPGNSTTTPTKAPTAGVCMNIKIYTLQESVWTETAVAEVGQYAVVGDTVRLALKGNSSAFVNGRFRVTVGGVVGSWVTTSKKNGNGEIYIDYQLENGGSYGVEGEIRK